MKQQGQYWTDHNGENVVSKHLPAQVKTQERTGQLIAGLATDLNSRLRAAKIKMVAAAKEALRNTPTAANNKTRFIFYTFDKEYRIEYDIMEENVRVYVAIKANPSANDYKYVDLNLAAIDGSEVPAERYSVGIQKDDVDFITPEEIIGILQHGPIDSAPAEVVRTFEQVSGIAPEIDEEASSKERGDVQLGGMSFTEGMDDEDAIKAIALNEEALAKVPVIKEAELLDLVEEKGVQHIADIHSADAKAIIKESNLTEEVDGYSADKAATGSLETSENHWEQFKNGILKYPTNLDEAVSWVEQRFFTGQIPLKVFNTSEDDFIDAANSKGGLLKEGLVIGLSSSIRNELGLWERNNAIVKFFRDSFGFSAPGEISELILRTLHKKFNGQISGKDSDPGPLFAQQAVGRLPREEGSSRGG